MYVFNPKVKERNNDNNNNNNNNNNIKNLGQIVWNMLNFA